MAKKGENVSLSTADKWMISRLQRSEEAVSEAIASYRFDIAAREIYELVWNEYCDWYLEFCKPVLNAPVKEELKQRGTRRTLVTVLETIMRLAHPIMPFITEEIWQKVSPLTGKVGETIMKQNYPTPQSSKIDQAAEAEIEWVKRFILGVRKIKGEMNIPPGKKVPILLENATEADLQNLQANQSYIDSLAKLESIKVLDHRDEKPECAMTIIDHMKMLIPLAGLIDKNAGN